MFTLYRSIIGASQEPYRVDLLFTFDTRNSCDSSDTPIPKVIRSVSDSFLERSAPNVNDLYMFSGLAPFLERESHYRSLGLEGRFAFTMKINIDPIWCETAQLQTGPVRFDFPKHCSHCIGSIPKPDRKSIRYSMNIALITCCALFLKSDWLVVLLFLLK